MKIFAISDLHLTNECNKPMEVFGGNWENYIEKIEVNWKKKVTDDDIILIAGDISWAMKLEETKTDFKWLGMLPGKKILIRGNHDYWWKSISNIRSMLPENIYAIQNDAIKIGQWIFCGSRGWNVPEAGEESSDEDKKILNKETERFKLTLKSAKALQTENEEIILLTHFPPFNSKKQDNEFTQLFESYGVKKVVFGHIHGHVRTEKFFEKNGIQYYLTSCDQIENDPVVIE